MKRNYVKVFKGILASAAAVSVVGVSTPLIAAEITEYTIETKNMYTVVEGVDTTVEVDYITNPNGGATLALLHNEDNPDGSNKYILEKDVDGYTYAFKDMNKNGTIDIYEDWREDVDTRATALANELASTDEGIKQIAGLMLFSSHEGNSGGTGLTSDQEGYLDASYVRNITDSSGNNVTEAVGWKNAMQAYVEDSTFNVPVNFASDPRSTAGSGDMYSSASTGDQISGWPSNLGMAATFSTTHMYNFAKATSSEYRALGIATALGPQIDLATDPRWLRNGGTFGEDTQLSSDMAQAYVDGSQSTYAADGSDSGWGSSSISTMIKHFPGDGAGEGGRESHMDSGKYAVYPGVNFDEHLKPFESALDLTGGTDEAAAIMTSYSIGIGSDGNSIMGEMVGSAYNYSKMSIIRDTYGYDGVVCTDWGVTSSPSGFMGMAWGAEGLTSAQRHYEILMAGTDMFGGNNDAKPIVNLDTVEVDSAYEMMVENKGEDWARERFATSGRRLITLTMQLGLFENPYVDLDESKAIAGSEEKMADGYSAQLDSVVMVKNADNTIQNATSNEKQPSEMTVYIPYTYTEATTSLFGGSDATWGPTMDLDTARATYGTVITDTKSTDANGKEIYVTPDLTGVDKVIVGMRSPDNGSNFSRAGQIINEDGTKSYYPLSLQYGPYTADGENVRTTSIAGDKNADGSQENRSYFGATSNISNAYDLTALQNAVAAVEATGKDIPVVVAINVSTNVIVEEFEEDVDAILVYYSVSEKAVYEVINGSHEPNGLLPMQMPANMDTVEANYEDVAHDLECYKDSEGNTYDFAFGLNWYGIIDDERVDTYNPNRPTTEIKTLTITADNFKLTNAEAKDATDKLLIEKANVSAAWTTTSLAKAAQSDDITISVEAANLAALKEAGKTGGDYTITFTATSKDETVTVSVTGSVEKAVTSAPSTAGSGVNSGDTTDVSGLAILSILALIVVSGGLVLKKRRML